MNFIVIDSMKQKCRLIYACFVRHIVLFRGKRAVLIFLLNFSLQDWYYRVFGRPEQKLQGELALVTGGGGGLGRLMALRLSKLGVDIVIWDINQGGNFHQI